MPSKFLIDQGFHPSAVKEMSMSERWAAKRRIRPGVVYRGGQRLGKVMGTQVGKGVPLGVSFLPHIILIFSGYRPCPRH
jgi:hypothetical protein